MGPPPGPPAMVIFERLAQLLLPVDGFGEIVETDDRWRLDPRLKDPAGDVVVWGRPPLPSGAGVTGARRFAGDRRRALSRLRRRPPGGLRVVDAVWWSPPEIKRSRFKKTLKDALAAGALITLSRSGRFERSLDAAWNDAGFADRAPAPRPSSGGSLRIEPDEGSTQVIFRAGPVDTPADPRATGGALELLERAGLDLVPRATAAGAVAGTGWLLETRLQGRRPPKLTTELVRATVALCAGLPRGPGPSLAFEEDEATIVKHLPDAREGLETLLQPHRSIVSRMPSVLRHGDLWAGNLLEDAGSLSGVVDWDAWHPSAVIGADLVHLLGAEGGGNLGERYLQRPWRRGSFLTASEQYWERMGVEPVDEVLDGAGAAWWAGQVAANLERLPHLAKDRTWLRANVHTVLESI